MKQFFTLVFSILIFFAMIDGNFIYNRINKYIEKDYFKTNEKDYLISSNINYYDDNKYYKKPISSYVTITKNFNAKNKNELLNIYYTILNNGYDKFSFYCDYDECLKDIEIISNNNEEFSDINQLVNPYNSFKSIISNYENKRVDVEIKKKYSSDDIKKIDSEINQIINKLNINNISNIKEKIRLFHDYLANNNVYDKEKENNNSIYHSDTAIGTLFEGYSVCSGYTDAMSLFLDKINLDNYKISNKEHTWNAVKIDNNWYHIDLTWDDPITNTNQNIIQYNYFLITTDELKSKNESEHTFNEEIFDFLS